MIKRLFIFLSCFIALLSNMYCNSVYVKAQDLPYDTPELIFTWGQNGYNIIEGYVLSNYTSLGQSGWAVEAMKLGVTQGVSNVAYCLSENLISGLELSSVANGGAFVGYSFLDSNYATSTISYSPATYSFTSNSMEGGSISLLHLVGSDTVTPALSSNSSSYRVYASGGTNPSYLSLDYFGQNYGLFRVYSSQSNGNYSLSFYGDKTSSSTSSASYRSSTTPLTRNEVVVDGDLVGYQPTYIISPNLIITTPPISFSDLDVSNWNDPNSIIEGIDKWAELNYPDYVSPVPLPEFDSTIPDYNLPSFVLPPDLPVETFPEISIPDTEPDFMSSLSNGISAHFTLLNALLDKFNIQWLVVLMLFIGLFLYIFAR